MSKEHPVLEKLYNDAHNGVQRRVYSGKHLEFPGLSLEKQPRDYQAASVWRIAQEGRALIDHFVGAGKTLTMIAAGMELRRMGSVEQESLRSAEQHGPAVAGGLQVGVSGRAGAGRHGSGFSQRHEQAQAVLAHRHKRLGCRDRPSFAIQHASHLAREGSR